MRPRASPSREKSEARAEHLSVCDRNVCENAPYMSTSPASVLVLMPESLVSLPAEPTSIVQLPALDENDAPSTLRLPLLAAVERTAGPLQTRDSPRAPQATARSRVRGSILCRSRRSEARRFSRDISLTGDAAVRGHAASAPMACRVQPVGGNLRCLVRLLQPRTKLWRWAHCTVCERLGNPRTAEWSKRANGAVKSEKPCGHHSLRRWSLFAAPSSRICPNPSFDGPQGARPGTSCCCWSTCPRTRNLHQPVSVRASAAGSRALSIHLSCAGSKEASSRRLLLRR